MNILYAASEALPFAASGGLADVVGSLPAALVKAGHDVRVVLPLYKDIKQELRDSLRFIRNFQVSVGWRQQYCGVFEGKAGSVTYYLIDNEYYFGRDGLYGFYDDCERFAFFARAILDMVAAEEDWTPQIIHCNDWQTGLTPVYLQIFYKHLPKFERMKTVFTIHNIQYQGKYGREVINDVLGIPLYYGSILEYDGCVNMMSAAFETSDKITTVSPTYAREILDPWFSHGLDRCLNSKQYKLTGFLNGIDTDLYNPETDTAIAKNFSASDLSGKAECKKALLSELKLRGDGSPLIGIVTRFVSHKGIDLIRNVFEEMVEMGYSFAILGSGDKMYEDFFREMAYRFPEKVSVTIGFIPSLSRRVYSACDMFLMPSQSEPCGLAQMISLRYGTIPIVRETGGLRDSVTDAGDFEHGGNGFTFKTYNAHDMLDAVRRAKALYDDKENWKKLQLFAMSCDCSWAKSAELYLGLYRELVG
ncbi:MAG: glycogen synthase GlgA [Ruminococcus sp.]|jgi:starch synthase|nr:glycogen synthase GlgA [Ruminococcus sp.]